MFAQNLFKHIKVPLFLTQSLYDTYTLGNLMGLSCVQKGLAKCTKEEMEIIELNRLNVLGVLQ